jgi:hypothetical protein
MSITPEGAVKRDLKKMFKRYEPDLYYFMPVQAGYGAAALDFHCCYRGFAFFVETKAGSAKLTARQVVTKERMEQSKAPVFVVRNQQSIEALEQWLLLMGE